MGEDLPFVDTGVDLNITEIALGEGHTCALLRMGRRSAGVRPLDSIGLTMLMGSVTAIRKLEMSFLTSPTGRQDDT